MAIQDQLGKMVGPLPLGAWLAIIVVAAGFGYWRSKQTPSDDTEPIEDPYGDPNVGTGATTGQWIDLDPPEKPEPTSNAPVDNDAWAVLAMQWFQAHNYDMAKAGQALAQYMAGTLTTKDVQAWALVRTVMMHIGSPPVIVEQHEPVPGQPTPPPVTKPPTPKPKPKPKPQPKKRYYTVKRGDTLTSIGRKYHKSWQSIYNANRSKIKNPNHIQPGWKLVIPN